MDDTACCASCTGADTARNEPGSHFGHKAYDVGTNQHPHGIHTVGTDALQSQCADLFPGVYRAVKQVVVSYEVLLQVIEQDEVNVVDAHIGDKAPQREG